MNDSKLITKPPPPKLPSAPIPVIFQTLSGLRLANAVLHVCYLERA